MTEPRRTFTSWWPYLLAILAIIVAVIVLFLLAWRPHLSSAPFQPDSVTNKIVTKALGEERAQLFELLPALLGYAEPRTVLFLFLNNTELRPGGGFIGVYAVAELTDGVVQLRVVEGSEIIDRKADRSRLLPAPAILQEHLGVRSWFFRDSNWYPDFAESSAQTLDFYIRENGVAAEDVDLVVGVTTDVLEELLAITGPIETGGITFTPENAVEQLEYEVEFGFKERGLAVSDRKAIISPLMQALFERLKEGGFVRIAEYLSLFDRLIEEKHILIYSPDEVLQKRLDELELSGRLKPVRGDYLLWTDANLASLKTDHALERSLSYHIVPAGERYRAEAEMTYRHTGVYDWRTSRYGTFAQLYVPAGAELINVEVDGKEVPAAQITTGDYQDKRWFGVFHKVLPQTTETVRFSYYLPSTIITDTNPRLYLLDVQKQLGTDRHGLTLSLDFGTTMSASSFSEGPATPVPVYEFSTDLLVDRQLTLELASPASHADKKSGN